MKNFKKFTIEESGEIDITDNTGDMAQQKQQTDKLEELQEWWSKNIRPNKYDKRLLSANPYAKYADFKNLINEAITQERERAWIEAEKMGVYATISEDCSWSGEKPIDFTEYNKTQKLIK